MAHFARTPDAKVQSRADLERIFEQHRQEIEQIAAEKILAGHFLEDNLLYVRAVDLSSDVPRRLTPFPHI